MNKRLFIVTDEGTFPQRLTALESIDIIVIQEEFEKKGFEVLAAKYSDIINDSVTIRDSYIYYASSQISERKSYIDDALYILNAPDYNNVLLPNYDIFRCHENKGYQEVYKRKVGIDSLNGLYYIDYDSASSMNHRPCVIKCVNGFGSRNVQLSRTEEEFNRKYRKYIRLNDLKVRLKTLLGNLHLKFDSPEIRRYNQQLVSRRYVLQPFVSGLSFDFKVLVFANKMFVLKRFVRKDDFKASGSGLWQFISNNGEISKDTLITAFEWYERLNLPFVSMDVCVDTKGRAHLIEFQGLHFGPVTLINSKGYFDAEAGFGFVEGTSNFELEISNSLLWFMDRRM